MAERREEKGKMTVEEAGRRGGETTKRKHGHESLEEHRRHREEGSWE
ncbi:MAG: hypothetical protein OIN66_02850 [Candidatus Methanoperedens sp.]|nr:hypothetical protein [Candidatus Methanoperedens sp.]